MTTEEQADLVLRRLNALARDLHDRGIAPDVILATALGWAVGQTVHCHGPERTQGHLRRMAGAVTLATATPAGAA